MFCNKGMLVGSIMVLKICRWLSWVSYLVLIILCVFNYVFYFENYCIFRFYLERLYSNIIMIFINIKYIVFLFLKII